jgi:hypothetical protein
MDRAEHRSGSTDKGKIVIWDEELISETIISGTIVS